MQVDFYLSNINYFAKRAALQSINRNDDKVKTIILTPDRNTLNIEKEVLEDNNTSAIFNLDVMTFSRLAKNYLKSKGMYNNILTKHAGVSLVSMILNEQKNNLKLYSKNINQMGFAEKIFETICLFKSCRIAPEDIVQSGDYKLLELKLADIQLIYSEYEKKLGEKFTDSFNQLDVFYKSIEPQDWANIDLVLVDFEDITPAIARVLGKLAKVCRSVKIATTYSKSVKNLQNADVYNNELFYSIKDTLRANGVASNNLYVEPNGVVGELSKVVGGKSVAKIDGVKMNTIAAWDMESEIKTVCSLIKKDLTDGVVSSEDVAIVLADMTSYSDMLEKSLIKAGIPYYIDCSQKLADNILTKIILSLIEIMLVGVEKYNVLRLLDSGVFGLTNGELNSYKKYINIINPKGKYLYSAPDGFKVDDSALQVMARLQSVVSDKVDSITISALKEKLDIVLENIGYEQFADMIFDKYIEVEDVAKAKMLSQSRRVLSEMWEELTMLYGNYEFEPVMLLHVVEAMVQDINLTLPPIKVGSVVVYDFETSYIPMSKHIYYMGAADGNFPKYSVETALINDREINKMSSYNKLSPTIALINKRKSIKVIESVCKAKERLTFSYVCVDSKGEAIYSATIVSELAKVLSSVASIDAGTAAVAWNDLTEVPLQNIVPAFAEDNIVEGIRQWNIFGELAAYRRNITSLVQALGDTLDVDYVANLDIDNRAKKLNQAGKIFFRSGKVSPSEFETYSRCPYQHFLKYGLRLKDEISPKVLSNDIGNIIHNYLYTAIYDLYNYRDDEEFVDNIPQFVKTNLDKIFEREEYKRFRLNTANNNVIRSLYQEVERLTIAIIEQLKDTDYVPIHREFDFGKVGGGYSITLDGGKSITISGKIDRVDEAGNQFIIIDYKTGSTDFGDFTDLASGKKIQLFTYCLMYNRLTKKEPVGAFYLPINNKTDESIMRKYRYKGVVLDDLDVIGQIDNELLQFPAKGKILRAERSAKGEIVKRGNFANLMLSKDDWSAVIDYLIDYYKVSANNVILGDISKTPLLIKKSSVCTHCPYKGICNFNKLYGNNYRVVDNIKTVTDLKEYQLKSDCGCDGADKEGDR